MASQALYRKYRSADFAQVIGQEHVISTLMASIASGTSSHAYLFTGPRGVGKTSVARLLARALNCTGATKPCNACDSCLRALNSSMDIVEIDAASNNGVDDVRDLRDKISIAPSVGPYKIYIIDEVHMLSSGAFNALLKTLEEPPPHAVFILATTEAHKVPATVMSRTQSFSFRPIAADQIANRLKEIAQLEAISLDDDAARLIAASAQGGFRDAIGLLDQLGSGGQAVTTERVRELLGYADEAAVEALALAMAAGDAARCLRLLDALIAGGAQPAQVCLQLIGVWRRAMIAGLAAPTGTPPANSMPLPVRCAAVIEALLPLARSPWPQVALEACIISLAARTELAPLPSPVAQLAPAMKPPAKRPGSPKPAADSGEALEPGRWPKVLVQLKQHNSSLCALLQMYPTDFDGDTVTVRSRFNFHRDLFNKPQNRQVIEAVAGRVFGRPITVTAITDEAAVAPVKGKNARITDTSDDLAATALEILGGEVID